MVRRHSLLLLLLALVAGGVQAQADPRVDALEKELAAVKRRVEVLEQERAKPAAKAARSPASADSLYARAQELEAEGNGREAVRAYTTAARSGSGKAALRLGEIYDKGLIGVSRDYAQSLKWYNAARVLGEETPVAGSR